MATIWWCQNRTLFATLPPVGPSLITSEQTRAITSVGKTSVNVNSVKGDKFPFQVVGVVKDVNF